jgi:uncharacterized protein (TIGR02001 family)
MRSTLLLALTCCAMAGAVHAQPWRFSGEAAVVTDYRYRGYSLSDEQPALQGGLTLSHDNGVYVGVWGSTIDEYGLDDQGEGASVELDFLAGRTFAVAGFDWDVGLAAYTYPGGRDVDYVEVPVSVSRTVGDFTGTLGLAYAPEQDGLGGEDNTYVYVGGNLAPESWPVALDATLGWEDGAFGDRKLDWSLSVARTFGPAALALRYVDSDAEDTDAAVVGALSFAF